MKKTKTFDCVTLKNDIQAKLLREYQNVKSGEAEQYLTKKLQLSSSPVAKLWKAIEEKRTLKKASWYFDLSSFWGQDRTVRLKNFVVLKRKTVGENINTIGIATRHVAIL